MELAPIFRRVGSKNKIYLESRRLADLEADRKRQEEGARREAERKQREEQARLEAEDKHKEGERLARLEAERKRKEQERLARLEAERKRREREWQPMRFRFQKGPVNKHAVAVIIGNWNYSAYSKDIPNVTYAHNDADAVYEYVTKALGYRADNIIFLKDATQADLFTAFGTREDHRGKLPRSRVLLDTRLIHDSWRKGCRDERTKARGGFGGGRP